MKSRLRATAGDAASCWRDARSARSVGGYWTPMVATTGADPDQAVGEQVTVAVGEDGVVAKGHVPRQLRARSRTRTAHEQSDGDFAAGQRTR